MIQQDRLRETQIEQFKLLEKLKDICEKEGLKYYLLGGSTLGAIRHKGFIPWDDDIDVGLARKDYEILLKVADKYLSNGERIHHYSMDSEYPDYTAKLENTNVQFTIQKATGKVRQSIWIDIFPLDGVPQNKLQRKLHFLKVLKLRRELSLCFLDNVQFNEDRSLPKRMVLNIAKVLPTDKILNQNRLMKRIDRTLMKYPLETSVEIGNYMGAYYEKEIMPKEIFGDGVDTIFEMDRFIVPEKTDEYLHNLYGDYMKLPPKEKCVPKHSVLEVRFLGGEK